MSTLVSSSHNTEDDMNERERAQKQREWARGFRDGEMIASGTTDHQYGNLSFNPVDFYQRGWLAGYHAYIARVK